MKEAELSALCFRKTWITVTETRRRSNFLIFLTSLFILYSKTFLRLNVLVEIKIMYKVEEERGVGGERGGGGGAWS